MGLFLALCLPLEAQTPAFRRIDQKDGIPQSQIETFMEDSNGFLWIGTQSGVARMGAGGIKVFDLSSGLEAGRVVAFLEDSEGGIWVAQMGAPLARIRGSLMEAFDAAKGLPENNCMSLVQSPDRQVLVGTAHGVYRLQKGRFDKLVLGPDWDSKNISGLAFDPHGTLWVGRRDGRVGRWTGSSVEDLTPAFVEPSPRIRGFACDPQGRLWVLSQTTLWSRAPEGPWERWSQPGFPEGVVFETLSISAGGVKLLAMAGKGLWIQPPQGPGTWYSAKDGLPDERVRTACLDRRGLLWIGTSGEYVYMLASMGLRTIARSGESAIGSALCMEELAGDIYIGSGRGLHQWKEGRGLVRRWTTADGLPGNEIWGACADGRGNLWVGTERGLALLKGGRIQGVPAFKDRRVYQILRDGTTFLVGHDRGISRLDGQGRELVRIDFAKYSLPSDVAVVARARDRILVGTAHGLWELRGDDLHRIHADAPFANVEVLSLYEHADGSLWVGTSKGLYIHREGRWALLKEPEDLPNSYVYFLGSAGNGLIAVGHGRGVTLMDGRGKTFHLNQNLGLVHDEANQGSVFLDSKGRLWMGMATGVNILEPGQPLPTPSLPRPTLLDIRHAGGSCPPDAKLVLAPRPEFVEFEFDEGLPITVTPPLYEVKLEGQSGVWQRLKNSRQMRYVGLPGGTYTFRVRASLDGHAWKEGEPFAFRVKPTWFEHPAGRGLLLLALLAAVLGLVRWRTHRLLAQAEELEARVEDRTRSLDQRNRELREAHEKVQQVLESKVAFSRMVVHDLRSPLTTMTLIADQMTQEALDRGELPPGEIGLLQKEAQRVEDLLKRLLDQAKSEAAGQSLSLAPAHPKAILEGLEEVLHLKATAAGLAFEFEEDLRAGGVQVLADPLALQQVVLNLYGNALKYTPVPGQLGLRSRIEEGAWAIEVWDTGRGFDPTQVETIFKPFTQVELADITKGWGLGLNIVKTLVDAHHGLIEVESELGKGTTFRVLIPLLQV